LVVPGVADRENLQPAYDSLSQRIWQVDPDRLVFYAAITWDDFVPTGFEHAPANNSEKSVFAFHYY